jgi:hypothetical protein
MNEGAGHGDLLLVTLHLESGEGLLFIVDTGEPFSLLDKSLEPTLGKPLKTTMIYSMYGATPATFYKTPRLYLGNIPLQISDRIATMDFKQLSDDLNQLTHSNHQIRGLLGLDGLQHYCLQLDFVSKKIHFLDPDYPGNQDLGKAFPLTFSHSPHCVFVRGNLAGIKGASSVIDTGMNFDGDVLRTPVQQRTGTSSVVTCEIFPNGMFGGNSYTNLSLGNGKANVLGLGFLARNLVTFNFPKRTMYLRQTNIGPLTDKISPTNAGALLRQ